MALTRGATYRQTCACASDVVDESHVTYLLSSFSVVAFLNSIALKVKRYHGPTAKTRIKTKMLYNCYVTFTIG